GLPCESLKNTPDLWLKAVHPGDRARVAEKFKQINDLTVSDEFRILQLDLKERWVHLRTFPVRNEQGVAYRVAALAEDITERKRAEEQLAAAAEQLRERNDELLDARDQLERRVEERTADLARANAGLKE